MGPVRWIARSARRSEWEQSAESAVIGLVIVLYVELSALVAAWLPTVK